MMTYERAMRSGRWLSRRKRWLPWLFALSAAGALLVTTPFSIVYGSLLLSLLSLLLAFAGFAVRIAARRAPSSSLEDRIATRGIYSVVRFPDYLANILIVLGLTLYTGVVWYMVLVALLCWVFAERIILAEENSLANRCGDTFLPWARQTNAVFPRLMNWQASTCRNALLPRVLSQAWVLLTVASGFCLIDLLKNLRVEFAFRIGLGWVALLGFALLLELLNRVMKR